MSNVTSLSDYKITARTDRKRDEAAIEAIFAKMGFRMAVVSYVDANGITGSMDFMSVSRSLMTKSQV